jgi:NitT/TauT family transport system permease protein
VRRAVTAFVFFGMLVVVWHVLATSGRWPPHLLPAPADVGLYLWRATFDGTLLAATGVTLKRLAVGYVMGLAIGVPLGFLTARLRVVADSVGVLALALQTLPSVCWAPMALLWFGLNEGAVTFVVVMGTVGSILLATEAGIRGVPSVYIRAARTMGSRRLHILTHVVFPAALPQILGGLKQGWAFAWRSLMAAEIFIAFGKAVGLGWLLHVGMDAHAMEAMFAIMIVITLVGVSADRLLFYPVERWLHRRWGTDR